MPFKVHDTQNMKGIFGNWPETLIWSCIQNVMGSIYADKPNHAQSAMALLGDFCFFAGVPDSDLVKYKPHGLSQNFVIMVPQNNVWAALIENNFGNRAKKTVRYAIKKEGNIFDMNRLHNAVCSIAPVYSIKMIDKEIFDYCRLNNWSRDLVSQYPNYQTYQKLGLGAVVLKDGEPVSGASSYSTYINGIEIEIDTKTEFRRQGLAYACGAKLISECVRRNLYPSWDAQNKASVMLAEKLGYHFDHEYVAYEVKW